MKKARIIMNREWKEKKQRVYGGRVTVERRWVNLNIQVPFWLFFFFTFKNKAETLEF